MRCELHELGNVLLDRSVADLLYQVFDWCDYDHEALSRTT